MCIGTNQGYLQLARTPYVILVREAFNIEVRQVGDHFHVFRRRILPTHLGQQGSTAVVCSAILRVDGRTLLSWPLYGYERDVKDG